LLVLLTTLGLISQTQIRAQLAQQAQGEVETRDGGSRQILRSISIPPMTNAPFTATLHTEWIRGSADSGTMTVVNDRRIARDSSGRIYQERWFVVPKNGDQKLTMRAIQISDPKEHTLYTCWMVAPHECDLTFYGPAAGTIYKPQTNTTGPLPDGKGYLVHDDLGHQFILGVDTTGAKESTTFTPGASGNDQKMVTTREYWYSSQLGIDPISKVSDPRFGTQIFTITSLNLAEPDPKLFELPEGLKIVDQRKATTPHTD
jgi:hypothetical protein